MKILLVVYLLLLYGCGVTKENIDKCEKFCEKNGNGGSFLVGTGECHCNNGARFQL